LTSLHERFGVGSRDLPPSARQFVEDKKEKMMSKPCDLGAAEARELIGSRKLSPVELLESCIERIEAVNPAVNAIVTKSYERAREEAKRAEVAVMKGEKLGLLHGLPAAIKDLNETAGIRTTFGSPLFENHVPCDDEGVVARIRGQGAIILGKTNSPEFGVGSNTVNRVFGATGNPFDTSRTCGGSSGGAGVALATGMVPIANGSDSGASIRNPSAFCGVFGIRPSPGLVPSERRTVGLTTNGVQGPMGRDVRDTALLFAAMADYDSRDMLSTPIDTSSFLKLQSVDLAGLRVAISEDLGFAPVDEIVRQTFRNKIRQLEGTFARLEPYAVPMQNAERAYWGIRGLYFLAGMKDRFEKHGQELDKNLVFNMKEALAMSGADAAWAMAEQTRIYRDFQKIFESYDVLITPAANVLPYAHATTFPAVLQSRPARHYAEWYSISYGISLVGHPAAAIPTGLDPQGTPFGLQVVGPRYGDRRVLEVCLALEKLFASNQELRRPKPDLSKLAAAPKLQGTAVAA
jgi:amidase